MSCEHALNFDQWKTFSVSNSKEVSYLSGQNMYPNLKTTSHIKLKCFLWTKLLENLLLVLLLFIAREYLISVAEALMISTVALSLMISTVDLFSNFSFWPVKKIIDPRNVFIFSV